MEQFITLPILKSIQLNEIILLVFLTALVWRFLYNKSSHNNILGSLIDLKLNQLILNRERKLDQLILNAQQNIITPADQIIYSNLMRQWYRRLIKDPKFSHEQLDQIDLKYNLYFEALEHRQLINMDKDISPTYRLKSQIEDIFAQKIGLEAVVLLKDMRQFSAFV
jgi:hypothetical protein